MTAPAFAPTVPTFLKAPEAFGRLTEAEASEAFAYTLGVQAVLWGLQWVKAAEALRMYSSPLPGGAQHSPYDPQPHAVNVWGHARKLLNADTRLIETPNTETLYSIVIVDLGDGPVVVVHPDFGERYFRSSIWDIHSDTHTISQKQDGSQPPPYALVPVGWQGHAARGDEVVRDPQPLPPGCPARRGLRRGRHPQRPRAGGSAQGRRTRQLGQRGRAARAGARRCPRCAAPVPRRPSRPSGTCPMSDRGSALYGG